MVQSTSSAMCAWPLGQCLTGTSDDVGGEGGPSQGGKSKYWWYCNTARGKRKEEEIKSSALFFRNRGKKAWNEGGEESPGPAAAPPLGSGESDLAVSLFKERLAKNSFPSLAFPSTRFARLDSTRRGIGGRGKTRRRISGSADRYQNKVISSLSVSPLASLEARKASGRRRSISKGLFVLNRNLRGEMMASWSPVQGEYWHQRQGHAKKRSRTYFRTPSTNIMIRFCCQKNPQSALVCLLRALTFPPWQSQRCFSSLLSLAQPQKWTFSTRDLLSFGAKRRLRLTELREEEEEEEEKCWQGEKTELYPILKRSSFDNGFLWRAERKSWPLKCIEISVKFVSTSFHSTPLHSTLHRWRPKGPSCEMKAFLIGKKCIHFPVPIVDCENKKFDFFAHGDVQLAKHVFDRCKLLLLNFFGAHSRLPSLWRRQIFRLLVEKKLRVSITRRIPLRRKAFRVLVSKKLKKIGIFVYRVTKE